MVIRSKLSTNTLALLLSNGGSAALSLALSVLIGRVMGEDGLGVYVTALAWVFPLALAAEFGLGTLLTRDVAQRPDAAAAYLRATTALRLLMGGGLMLLLALAAPLLSADPAVIQGIRLSAPLVLIGPFFGVFTAVFRAHRIMWPVAALNLGMLAAQVGLTAWVFAVGGGIAAALAVNTVTSTGQLLAAWALWRWLIPAGDTGVRVSGWGLLRRAWPFAVAGILAALHMRLSVILLEHLTTTGEVGYYAAASRFVEAGRMLPQAFFDALFPLLAVLVADTPAFQRLFRRVTWALVGFGLLVGVGGLLAGDWLIGVTFGAAFAPAVTVLQVGLWSLLPLLLKGGRTLYWYAQGHERFVNSVTVLTLALRVALSLWLIPLYGALGAALANLLVEAASCALLWLPIPQRRRSE